MRAWHYFRNSRKQVVGFRTKRKAVQTGLALKKPFGLKRAPFGTYKLLVKNR